MSALRISQGQQWLQFRFRVRALDRVFAGLLGQVGETPRALGLLGPSRNSTFHVRQKDWEDFVACRARVKVLLPCLAILS